MQRTKRYYLVLVPFTAMLLLFFLVPLITLLVTSLQSDDGGFALSQYAEIASSKFYLMAFKNSLLVSFLSALASIAAALFATYSITRLPLRLRENMISYTNLTSNFAGIPLAFAFIILLGQNGVVTLSLRQAGIDLLETFNLYSWSGIAVVYIYFLIPLAIMLLLPVFNGIEEAWKESAALLGAGPTQFWLRIGIPVLFPSIIGTFSILLANGMGAYATVYALTGSAYNLLPVRIDSLLTGEVTARPQLASALAVLMGMMLIAALLINEWALSRLSRRQRQ